MATAAATLLVLSACSSDDDVRVAPTVPPSSAVASSSRPSPTTRPRVTTTSTSTTTIAATTTTTRIPTSTTVTPGPRPTTLVDVAGLAPRPGGGYWTVSPTGEVMAREPAPFLGDERGVALAAPIVSITASPTGQGYWLLGADGGVFIFGDATFFGVGAPGASALASTPSGRGYWIVDRSGHVTAFGDAPVLLDLADAVPASPVVGMAVTPSGAGYWLLGVDGAVFNYGDAPFHGAGGPSPVVAMVPTLGGYSLLSADGTLTPHGHGADLGPSPLVLGDGGLTGAVGPLAIGVGSAMALGLVDEPLLPAPESVPAGSVVYLTFDDGPDPRWTPPILDLLAARGAPSTFCQLGPAVERHVDLVQRIVREGHSLCNHGWTHTRMPRQSRAEFDDEITRTAGAQVVAAGGRSPCLRPPYGSLNDEVRAWIAESGMALSLWTIDTRDWGRPGTHHIVNKVLRDVRPGSVVLMHDGGDDRRQTVAATALILDILGAAGYSFATLPDCAPLTTAPPITAPTTTTTPPPVAPPGP